MRAKVELFVDLDAVAADAAGALDQDAQASLYDTLDWFRLTQAHILGDARLLVARARGTCGTAWIFLSAADARRAEPFGTWYTLRFAPVFAGDPAQEDRSSLLADMTAALRKRTAHLSLYPLDHASNALLGTAFASSGWWTDDRPQTANWVAYTRGEDFAAYWARRPSQLKSTVRRKAVKARLDIRITDRFEANAWDAYEAVFAASWKGDEGSPTFLRALAQRTAHWGRMRMGLAYAPDGSPLAAQFWTVDGEVATIHKLAYVDAARSLSPGSILSHAMFAHVIDRDRPAVVDFGTGDDGYKADWMDEKRTLYRREAYDPASFAGLRDFARSRIAALVARRRSA